MGEISMAANTEDLISVIVPVYNVKPYLAEAIESVLYQTYTNLEVILVDDGSTDGSGEICDLYGAKDSRIRVIHQENRGLSSARNAGLDICSGDMIAFLDSDDAYCEGALFKMHEAMQQSGADIVECGFTVCKTTRRMNVKRVQNKRKTNIVQTGLYNRRLALQMQVDGYIKVYIWNKLYKREVWKELRFREGQNYEDVDIILPLLQKAENVYYLNASLVMYRRRSGSITASVTLKNVRDHTAAYRRYMNHAQACVPAYFDESHLKKVYLVYYDALLFCYFLCAGSRESGIKQYLEGLTKEIADAKRNVDISRSGMKTQIATFLYSYAPPILCRLIYRFYELALKQFFN